MFPQLDSWFQKKSMHQDWDVLGMFKNSFEHFRPYTVEKQNLHNFQLKKSNFCPTLFPSRWPIQVSRNTLYSVKNEYRVN